MDSFTYKNGVVHCEDVSLPDLAKSYGTPLYVYSEQYLKQRCKEFIDAFSGYPTLCCYAVKANGNLSLLKTIFDTGFGADVVSVGEIERAIFAGLSPQKIVFSGVGKRYGEIKRALELGILLFNVESEFELNLLQKACIELDKEASIAFRINPDIDAHTNPKITTGLHANKFGVTESEAKQMAKKIKQVKYMHLVGLSCHIGSQMIDISPIRESAAKLVKIANAFVKAGHDIQYVDIGGGLGIKYHEENPPTVNQFAQEVLKAFEGKNYTLIIEPGRSVIGDAGVLLSKVIGIKRRGEKVFVILDAAMNDLLRPTLYEAYHEIYPVIEASDNSVFKELIDFVGPVCETGDYLGKERFMAVPNPGDLIFVGSTGAYAMSMASNYNCRPNPAEVLVDKSEARIIRKRQDMIDICGPELDYLK